MAAPTDRVHTAPKAFVIHPSNEELATALQAGDKATVARIVLERGLASTQAGAEQYAARLIYFKNAALSDMAEPATFWI